MTYRSIRVVGDPVLRTECDPITAITPGVRQLVEDLLETVDEDGRAGLAANQIGVASRAFSWNIDGDIGYILNPVITHVSEETQDGDEGCLSVPGLFFPRIRGAEAACEGIDLDGRKVTLEGDGIIARLIQHEVGHLNGELYIDGLERSVRKKALRAIRETL
ncbi:peptide deformylase [Helcobacillus massiliensis]|uniref:Peptide deformylase n=1 Tax=Helcobacillus massiliensis TaxID=521392 RepID=A0A839QUI0_9MICO|nr:MULTISPECIES: peptide deformylase [Helcobacillus]MBB3022509.1 peptide deformylase [Helcobacillus massiliensis]MCG7426561.1 peptide deformylase [Helcobacillus sp. ACRRO]MCT1557143.1 peptide deformylase [Helcobacillus massiliensis]MCT2036122.1 peptide deformylase [Helcobacillus massiliensis]MCT2331253.1 peptide deformylase [Helcobacillus massiliensis]